MSAPTFDLQAHSTASDGALDPGEVVRRARDAGVRLLSLTDHDTVAGVQGALDAAGELGDIAVVPGIELSVIDGRHADLHVCGYGIDHRSAALGEALEAWRADRSGRADRMVAALRELGWQVDESEIVARRALGLSIGRPHVAAAAFGHPGNAARVAAESLETATDLLVAYLVEGAPAYRHRTRPTIEDAVAIIHGAGGVAVWAHPFWDVAAPDEVRETLERFAAIGVDGVEAFYPTFDAAQSRVLHAEAERMGLLTTGSSDFHGPEHPNFSRFRAFSTHGLEPRLGPIGA
ncbi:PHP domain-containing protein [Patulibacter sp. S7RM1-6]